VGANWGKNF